MRNARADRADSRLVPLYAVATNVEIEDFPKTLGDIDKLECKTIPPQRLWFKVLY
jgi:hypothetical protein